MFFYHLIHLDPECLAGQVIALQRKYKVGLNEECEMIMAELNIREGFLRNVTKSQWKFEIKARIKDKNRSDILEKIKIL